MAFSEVDLGRVKLIRDLTRDLGVNGEGGRNPEPCGSSAQIAKGAS